MCIISSNLRVNVHSGICIMFIIANGESVEMFVCSLILFFFPLTYMLKV